MINIIQHKNNNYINKLALGKEIHISLKNCLQISDIMYMCNGYRIHFKTTLNHKKPNFIKMIYFDSKMILNPLKIM